MPNKLDITAVIDSALSPYLSTLQLLDTWLTRKIRIHEFLILACARLDSLSNLAYAQETQKKCFTNFLKTYSPHRQLFAKVSVPDFYYFLSSQAWALPGTIKKAGRLHMFDPKRDSQFMTFLWNSKVPLLEKDVGHMLGFLLRALRTRYRVAPNQKLQKLTSDTTNGILAAIKSEAVKYQKPTYRDAGKAIGSLLEEFTVASLLYQEYRCAAIHGYHVRLSEALFFENKEPYWSAYYHKWISPGRFLKLHFPGAFLVDTLRDCTENYKRHLKAVRKLPAELFFEFCNTLTDLEYLDEESIPKGKDLKPGQ